MSFSPFEPSFFGIGSAPASGMPGAPIGPALRSTITVCGVTSSSGSSMRFSRSSSESNTSAGPSCWNSSGVAEASLIAAPPGARLPVRIAIASLFTSGLSSGRMTLSST